MTGSDPLNEHNHSTRYDRSGDRWVWCEECAAWCRYWVKRSHQYAAQRPTIARVDHDFGPLTFTPRPANDSRMVRCKMKDAAREIWRRYVGTSTKAFDEDNPTYANTIEKAYDAALAVLDAVSPYLYRTIPNQIPSLESERVGAVLLSYDDGLWAKIGDGLWRDFVGDTVMTTEELYEFTIAHYKTWSVIWDGGKGA